MVNQMKPNSTYLFVGLCLLLIASIVAGLSLGAIPIDGSDMYYGLRNGILQREQSNIAQQVFFNLRFPRVLLSAITGGSLAVSGLIMQAITRNPIVEAGLTGTSAGAALGASLVFVLTPLFPGLLSLFSIHVLLPTMAFIGALLATLLVYKMSGVNGYVQATTLLLVGVAVNAMAFSGIGFLSYIARDPQARSITFWNLGGFSGANWLQVGISVIIAIAAVIYFTKKAFTLDVLQLGEKEAVYLGLSIKATRRNLLLVNTLLVATLTAWCGVIAFVGLIIPHLMRKFTDGRHRPLIAYCFVGGSILMVLADLAARLLMAPAELPVGIVTALIGAPIFILLIRKQLFYQ